MRWLRVQLLGHLKVVLLAIFVSLVDIIAAELLLSLLLARLHIAQQGKRLRSATGGRQFLTVGAAAVKVSSQLAAVLREVLLESVEGLSLVVRLEILAALRLYLLLLLDHLVDFVYKLLPEVDFLQVLCIFSEYLEEESYILLIRELEGFLDYSRDGIVTILVQHNVSECVPLLVRVVGFVHERVIDQLLAVEVGIVDEDFDDARGEFGVTIQLKILRNNFGDFEVYVGVFEGNDFADYVVGELVVDELSNVLDNLVDQSFLLLAATALEARLHHAAALLVSSNLEAVVNHCFVDWLLVSWANEHFQAGLHHVIAVDVD